jgi:hypothetical protein
MIWITRRVRRTLITSPPFGRLAAVAALAVSLAGATACSSGDGALGPASGDDNDFGDGPRSEVPNELVGTWYTGGVSPTQFYNPHTGSFGSPGYGNGLFYTFTPDGGFVKGFQLSSSLYGCGTITLVYIRGTVTVDESSFDIHPSSGEMLEQNTCSNTSEERPIDLEAEAETLAYEVGVDESGDPVLYVETSDGYTGVLRYQGEW